MLDVIERDQLLQKVQTNGTVWKAQLEQLAVEFPRHLKAVTGRGYMIGLLMQDAPAPYLAALREAGLLVTSAGTNTVRLLPPLIATREQLDWATAIIRAVLAAKSG